MKFSERLWARARAVKSLLCVGLDPNLARIPGHFKEEEDPIWAFCRETIDATAPYAMAFKPQIAYFASEGAEPTLERVCAYIREKHPDIPVILDSKRGDIGSTAEHYAREAFERYQVDAVTLSPFMGFDTIEPFMKYADKGLFVLCRTSNPGGNDFQNLIVDGEPLYKHMARLCQGPWNHTGELGIVVGATYPAELASIRAVAPTIPILIPGIGAQGGSMTEALHAGRRKDGLGVVLNVGRSILYPKEGETQASMARAFRDECAESFA